MASRNDTPLSPAQQELAAANVALAFWMAGRYAARYGLDRAECESAALLGLVRGARAWREGRGAAFSTYAFLAMRTTLGQLREREERRADRFALPIRPQGGWRDDANEPRRDDGPCRLERDEEARRSRAFVRRILKAAGPYAPALRLRFVQGLQLDDVARALGLNSRQAADHRVKAGLALARAALSGGGFARPRSAPP